MLPHSVPLKRLLAIRVCLALMYEPSGSLWHAICDVENAGEMESRLARLEALAEEAGGR